MIIAYYIYFVIISACFYVHSTHYQMDSVAKQKPEVFQEPQNKMNDLLYNFATNLCNEFLILILILL